MVCIRVQQESLKITLYLWHSMDLGNKTRSFCYSVPCRCLIAVGQQSDLYERSPDFKLTADSFIWYWKLVLLNFLHLFHSSPTLFPLETTYLFSVSINLFLFCSISFVTFHTQVKSCGICLDISLSMIPSRSVHVLSNGKLSFIFMVE